MFKKIGAILGIASAAAESCAERVAEVVPTKTTEWHPRVTRDEAAKKRKAVKAKKAAKKARRRNRRG